jgi:hypothetical protein
LIKKSSKKNQEQTIALALCFFLYGQPFYLAALKKAITRIGTAFVRGSRSGKIKNSVVFLFFLSLP